MEGVQSKYLVSSEEKTRKKLVKEGIVAESSSWLSSSFITPFALAIGANSAHIGFLSSFTELASPIGQWIGSRWMEHKSRKKILVWMTLLQAVLTLSFIGLAYLAWKGMYVESLPLMLIVSYVAWTFFLGLKIPSFFSFLGDVVPQNSRGKYIADRNRIMGFIGMFAFISGAFLLDYFKTKGLVLAGFAVLFLIAGFLRFISSKMLHGMFIPRFRFKKADEFSLIAFLKRYDNFGKFAVYQAFFYFSLMIASPFFAVYMLKDLNFSYLTFTFVTLSATFFYLALNPLAGKFSDRYGNLKLLYIAGICFPIVPLIWLFLDNPLYLVFTHGLISGLGNAAFTIAVSNFTYDSVRPEKRGICVAYTAVLIGIGVFLGAMIGGLLIEYAPINWIHPILFVFLISAGLRALSAMIFLPQLEEPREVNRIRGLSMDWHHPFRTVRSDVIWFKRFLR